MTTLSNVRPRQHVPFYDFVCSKCHRPFLANGPFLENFGGACPDCGGELRKTIDGTPVDIKMDLRSCSSCNQLFYALNERVTTCPRCWHEDEEQGEAMTDQSKFDEYDHSNDYYLTAHQALAEFTARIKALMRALDRAGCTYSFDPKRHTCSLKTGPANVSVEVSMGDER